MSTQPSVAGMVKSWAMDQTNPFGIQEALEAFSNQDHQVVRVAIHYYKKKGLLKVVGTNPYRYIANEPVGDLTSHDINIIMNLLEHEKMERCDDDGPYGLGVKEIEKIEARLRKLI